MKRADSESASVDFLRTTPLSSVPRLSKTSSSWPFSLPMGLVGGEARPRPVIWEAAEERRFSTTTLFRCEGEAIFGRGYDFTVE